MLLGDEAGRRSRHRRLAGGASCAGVGRREQHEEPDEARVQHADVESLLDAPVLFAGRIVEPTHEEARYLLLGVTAGGRRAALVFARRGEKLRPISCRAMRKREKEEYDAAT